MSKKFILEVQEGCTDCEKCPFSINKSVYHICNYLNENGICNNYDFNQINIEEYNERH